MKSINCPVCSNSNSIVLDKIDVHKQHLIYANDDEAGARKLSEVFQIDGDQYAMHECSNCGLQYANPIIAPDGTWYDLLYSIRPLYPAERWEFDFVQNQVSESQSVLDFGCGSGEFIKRLVVPRKLGIDFSISAINIAKKSGLDVISFDESAGLQEQFESIVSFHCLEHLPDPHMLFRVTEAVAKPGTKLWIAVPSNKRATRLFEETECLDQPPHHMTRWCPEAFMNIAESTSWKFENIIYEPCSLRTKLWEVSRRMPGYKVFSSKGSLIEKLFRLLATVPILLLKRNALRQLSGFSMLAEYRLTSDPRSNIHGTS